MVYSKPIRTYGKTSYIAFQEPDELLVPVLLVVKSWANIHILVYFIPTTVG